MAVVLALITGMFAVVTTALTAAPAQAAVVADSLCKPSDPNLRNGQCYKFPDGRITWLGNFTNPNGRVFFCIDKNKDSRLPATAPKITTAGLKNQFGKVIGKAEVAALNYVINKWAAGSTDLESAAIALIIRQVMSDTQGQMPGNLKVGQEVSNLAGGLPANVLSKARAMWSEASDFRGPWTLELKGSTSDMKVGQTRTLKANVWSPSGRRVPGVKIDMTYNSRVTGPSKVTSITGTGTEFTVKAVSAGALSVKGEIEGPSGNGTLFDPKDNSIQRGWIAEKTNDKAKLELSGDIGLVNTRVVTATSDKLVEPGVPFHDVVRVTDFPAGRTAVATARLYGPYPAQPTATDCLPAQLAGTVTFSVNASGTYNTPTVSVTDEGYYTWVVTLAATAESPQASHACGIVQETTLVSHPLIEAEVATEISEQASRAGDTVSDTIIVTGLAGETVTVPITIEWTLYGPVAPVDGACDTVDWADAAVLESGQITVTEDGSYPTPGVRLPAAGCFSYGEELLATAEVAPFSHPVGHVTQTTLADRNKPSVETQVSSQNVAVGAELVDTIKVSGMLAGESAEMVWTLYGPLEPVNGKCDALDWSTARVHDQDTITVTGDGSYVTRSSAPVAVRGCYTYAEVLQETDAIEEVVHEPGKPSQTTLVDKSRPSVRTLVSSQITRTGTRLHDTVWVSGLNSGDRVRVEWTLYGPAKPVNGKCTNARWSKAKVFDKGSFTATKNGRYKTRSSKVLKKKGCYTYAERIQETASTYSHWHKPGKASQTSLVRKPGRPGIPTGPKGWGKP
ncbi:hypothetical protein ACLM5J_19650 [Nocardioides sp. Bht2]|uniref:hypothetical protein n=1 Tax=Nocardioides sp. Bht2 TaxID=3392297 RepID=UPI0039B41072